LFYKDTNGDIQYFIADTGYFALQNESSSSSGDNEILQWMGI